VTRTLTDPYTVLGVPKDADAAQIKSAYRQLALRYHPDRNAGSREAEERFKEISEAYATLRDPEMRARFDRYGQTGRGAAPPDFSTVDWQTIFQEADIRVDWGSGGQVPRTGNVMFDALFGVMTGMMRSSGLLPGEDREVSLLVTVPEARHGGVRRVRVPGPSVCTGCRGSGQGALGICEICGGRGVLRSGAEVEVEVPPFRKDDTKLRLRGLGGPGRPPGDTYVRLHVQVPPGVRLESDGSLHAELTLLPREAEGGTVTTLLGAEVQVPSGSSAGDTLRVAGGGIGGGDMILTLKTDLWGGLWRRVRNALS
jgi:molecular chaperone DnaJ